MAKKVKITDQRKIRGIRRRWLINSVGVVLLVLVLALATFSAAIWSYYYSSTTSDLQRRAESTAGGFASYTRSQYWTNAQNAVQRFEEKTKLELQFLDASGSVQYSSNDLAAGTTPDTPEIQESLTNQEVRVWIGSDPDTGERIATASAPIVYHGQTVAVVRYVTSLVNIDRQYVLAVVLACLLGAVIFALVYFSNLYFVRSIVEPVASITETARLIADGSYGVQIEKKYDDEVGELTDTINDMSLKIKQSERMKSEFISSVSHELRTPLSVILMQCDALLARDGLSGEVREEITVIQRKADSLSRMISQLLLLSRADQGREKVTMEILDFTGLSQMAAAEMEGIAAAKGIRLETAISPDIMVRGDETLLIRLWLNLLQNAVTYGKEGGCIHMGLWEDEDTVTGYVEDDGIGISARDLPHIWERFYRADSSRSNNGSSQNNNDSSQGNVSSSGLGLSMVQWIISVHKGTIQAVSEPGRGSRFTFRIPKEKKS